MLRVGIVGCGTIAQRRHIPEFAANPHCKLTAFWSYTPGKAAKLAQQYDAVGYTDLDVFLDSGLDVIAVCSTNATHAEITVKALDKGIHVLCEKPMATTMEECEAMVAAAKRSGKKLMIAQNQRFASVHQEARKRIAAGEIGNLLTFDSVYGHAGPEDWLGSANPWFFDKEKSVFGCMADIGIHKTDLLHYLLGEPIVKVSAILRTMDKKYPNGELIAVDDNAFCLYQTASGIPGTLHVSWTLYGQENNSTRIYGTNGVLRLYDDPEHSLIFEHRDGSIERIAVDHLATNDEQNAGGRVSTGVIDAFVDAVLFGKPTPASGEEAVKAMRVVFAAEESGRTGLPVVVSHDSLNL